MSVSIPERFSLTRMLREDRYARTFVGHDHLLDNKEVVVKILKNAATDRNRDSHIEHFSPLIGLRHNQLATVFDVGLTKRQHVFYVREYFPDPAWITKDPIGTMKLLVSVVSFLSISDFTHGAIKPSNIFVTRNALKLTDAKPWLCAAGDEESLHFTAPEVLQGEHPNRETDLYSLGAVLYHLLTGQHLFEDPDLDRLKSKYCFAFVQAVPFFCSISAHISELILQLLDKHPGNRTAAFDQLMSALNVGFVPADHAAFVGREDLLERVFTFQTRTKVLRTFSIEGEIGSGKSRLLEQWRLRLMLNGLTFLRCSCKSTANNLDPVREALQELTSSSPGNLPDVSKFVSRSVLPEFLAGNPTATREYNLDRTISDLIGLLGSVAQRVPIFLSIENVQDADFGTARFLEQLAFRASDVSITLILTGRPSESEPKWMNVVASCLGDEFLRIRIASLPTRACEELVFFLGANPERKIDILKLAAGNPLLIEHYAKWPHPSDDSQLAEFADSIVESLQNETMSVLQILSVFRRPVSIDVIARIGRCNVQQVAARLETAKRLGLISIEDGAAQIRFPLLQNKIYASLSKEKRRLLNRYAFIELLDVESNREILADYAFEARMFLEARSLYSELANNSCSSQNFRVSLKYYQRLGACNARLGQTFRPKEQLNIALCYGKLGKHGSSDRIYRELLSNRDVQNDPHLLSHVYYRLAITTRGISAEERHRLIQQSIHCLPDDATSVDRLMYICIVVSRFGEHAQASEILRRIEKFPIHGEEKNGLLNVVRATLVLHRGDFRAAAKCYKKCTFVDRAMLLNNLAHCYELLGDLQTGLQYELQSREFGIKNGTMYAQVQSLNNIASIKMKCGEMHEAERLIKLACVETDAIAAGDMVHKELVLCSTYCDRALVAMYRGEYLQAQEYLNKVKTHSGQLLPRERLLSEIVQCTFMIRIGLTKKVCGFLQKSPKLSLYGPHYSEIEHVLLEAQLPEFPIAYRLERLQHAMALSQNLGTQYQYSELLLALTSVLLELNDKKTARLRIKDAVELARKNGYRLCLARAHLLRGAASENIHEKQDAFLEVVRLASEMGLPELIAEAAYHLGVLSLEAGNLVTAREYLIRSTTITARLAEGVPVAAKAKYLAKTWRREAVKALGRCNESMLLHGGKLFSTDIEKYFDAVYRFTMSAGTATSVDDIVALIEKTLHASINRSAVIIAQHGSDSRSMTIRIKMSPELMERIDNIRKRSKGRVYFESDEKSRRSVGWIPFNSESRDGGIYVSCRSHEPQFSEKEIELLTMIGTIASSALKRLETRNAQEAQPHEITEFHGIIGASKAIKDVYSQIQMAATNTANVLIEGESGTGKELVAKAIHAAGPRAKEPFIPVDCGAIPDGLIEAELFGSKKGSYTGAVVDRPGLFEAANRGTIFLDEISNTTLVLQAKLLRVIQEREVRRIGETKGRAIDVRLIVASNQNLEALVQAGTFRKDLLYRLNVLHIKVPPLRNRREDIPMLAHTFLKKLNTTNNTKKYFVPQVVEHLCTQPFPGNVRELQNAIERGFFLAKGTMISQVPLEALVTATDGPADEVQTWFKDISEGRKDFWSVIHNRYKRRDISREKVVAFVDFGLRATRGSYKNMASSFRLKEKEYRRFMDFLRRNDCLLDFRPYRKASTAHSEN